MISRESNESAHGYHYKVVLQNLYIYVFPTIHVGLAQFSSSLTLMSLS